MVEVTGNSTEEGVVGEAGGGMEWATGHKRQPQSAGFCRRSLGQSTQGHIAHCSNQLVLISLRPVSPSVLLPDELPCAQQTRKNL